MVFFPALKAMSALLLSILGLSSGLQHCPMWKEISPCTCRLDTSKLTTLTCEKMSSYHQVVEVFRGHFSPSDRVSLRLSSSDLKDLQYRSFKELNMTVENLKLNHDHFGGPLNEETFDGLSKVKYLSFSDNNLEMVPEKLWNKMPAIDTLDLGRTKIKSISQTSFSGLHMLECLVLPGNQISQIDRNSFPNQLQRLHLGRNEIKDLNDTLRNLSNLRWLFVNSNELTDLENQLPFDAPNLELIHASHNKIGKLPPQLKTYPMLESLFFQHNKLKSIDGTLSKSAEIKRIVLEHNQIDTINKDDFASAEQLDSLHLGHNQIKTLNNSLVNLRGLNFLNVTYNYLREFSFRDIVGLHELKSIDLSYNHINALIGPAPNLVESNIKLTELKLDHNRLETLNGALSGLPELLRLNLSFNRLRRISPDDFIGLDQLRLLDVSHNHLTTLEETSKTFLPRLSELKASNNYLTVLERDFHGLPVLCHADLSNNQIVALGRDLVSKTRCKIEHGVHEGTWDTLKIYLQDNPILCDAAWPEISSAMEINHTRLYGVSRCSPLSEQPTTSKPNAFLGYIPELIASTPATVNKHRPIEIQTVIKSNEENSEPENIIQVPSGRNSHANSGLVPVPTRDYENVRGPAEELLVRTNSNEQYTIENHPIEVEPDGKANQQVVNVDDVKPIALTLQKIETSQNISVSNSSVQGFDPVEQKQQITKLASQIEELRTRVDQLSNQNRLLLNQHQTQHNQSNDQQLTIIPPNYDLGESRKP